MRYVAKLVVFVFAASLVVASISGLLVVYDCFQFIRCGNPDRNSTAWESLWFLLGSLVVMGACVTSFFWLPMIELDRESH